MYHGKWRFNGTIYFAVELKRTCLVCPSWFAVATQTWLTESCVKCFVGVQIYVFTSFLQRFSENLYFFVYLSPVQLRYEDDAYFIVSVKRTWTVASVRG